MKIPAFVGHYPCSFTGSKLWVGGSKRHCTRPAACHACAFTRSPPALVLQGNCSDPDAVSALGLSAEEAAGLLPLKPFQCLVIFDDTLLMMNSGKLLIDNLYLLLIRRRSQSPDVDFVVAGGAHNTVSGPDESTIAGGDLYVTNVTFHGEHRGYASAVNLEVDDASLVVRGTIHAVHAVSQVSESNTHNVTVQRNAPYVMLLHPRLCLACAEHAPEVPER